MELRIQRPESGEAESASVLLREGDTFDDCKAAFDAISLSGGPKKALLSLGLGMLMLRFAVLQLIILFFNSISCPSQFSSILMLLLN